MNDVQPQIDVLPRSNALQLACQTVSFLREMSLSLSLMFVLLGVSLSIRSTIGVTSVANILYLFR